MSLSHRFHSLRGKFDTKARTVTPARLAAAALLLVTIGFGGCAQQPQQFAAAAPRHGKEYFPSTVYGPASRRVIADGQPVPRGGGQYLVGKPYKVAGQTYYPSERRIVQIGNASWYGDAFHGRLTANGEIYDRDGFTAAHPTMPLPSYARVTNLRNNYSMIVRVNDRGPYASNRIMDVSRRVAEALDYKRYGTTRLRVEYVGRASLAGSDDAKLYATLRNGAPAQWQPEPTMVAAIAPPARVASIAPYAPVAPRQEWREPRAEAPPAVVADQTPRRIAPGMPDVARTEIAVAEPVRREVVRSRPNGIGEERSSRAERVEAMHDKALRAARKPASREDTKDAEKAKQFALLELRPPHRDSIRDEASPSRIGGARRPAVLPPARPGDVDAMTRGRIGARRHDMQMARVRDD